MVCKISRIGFGGPYLDNFRTDATGMNKRLFVVFTKTIGNRKKNQD